MSVDIEKLEELTKAITPLPWRHIDKGHFYVTDANPNRKIAKIGMVPRAYAKNAEYIVAACNAVPELIKIYREADDEAADANSAWQKVRRENLALRERVQTLEKMVDYLAEEFSDGDDQSECNHPHLACQYRDGYWCHAGLEGQKQCWIRVAEQVAKEAGE